MSFLKKIKNIFHNTKQFKEEKNFKYSWEEAIEILRNDPEHQSLIFNSYLTSDLVENCKRFYNSSEFIEVIAILKKYIPNAHNVLDMPAGNGIATYAFSLSGFNVTSVEPDDSKILGRQAIEKVLSESNLQSNIVNAWGEKLPFDDNSFDVVYVRQGLHHASNLKKMLLEINRVLVSGGVLIACREHVIDDYNLSLKNFLDSQVDHQLYGGEYAFTRSDYRKAINGSGLNIKLELKPFDSIINIFPNTVEKLNQQILNSTIGRILSLFIPNTTVIKIGIWQLNRKKIPGRLYSFVAVKN
jgi:SAM-dependent methyltransferase